MKRSLAFLAFIICTVPGIQRDCYGQAYNSTIAGHASSAADASPPVQVPTMEHSSGQSMPGEIADQSMPTESVVSGTCFGGSCLEPPCSFEQCFIRAESVWLQRNTGPDRFFAGIQVLPAGIVTGISTDDIDFDFEPGIRLTYGCPITPTTLWEVSYMGLYDWEQNLSLVSTPQFRIFNGGTNLLTTVDRESIHYDSNFNSFETNVRAYVNVFPHVSLFAGMRVMRLHETFSIVETGAFNAVPATASVQQDTHNTMVGIQIGGDSFSSLSNDIVNIGTFWKLGVFSNFSDVKNDIARTNGPNGPTVASTSEDGIDLTLMAESGVLAKVKLSASLTVLGGYQLMFLDGVALAPNQGIPLAPNVAQTLNDDDQQFYHGPFGGVELRWGGRN